ncbi:mannose-1-phosphate guanylyltransferase [Urechidicola vernalis]|uniref:Sugar phosphate nucleotidyltransferase n=1 Tax=Urechidicola vernalis TaxID=3075600 RepID=A0ABU2YAQ4_9FLAO|nr:sugar phosphate nucleotidyltransferase [Urechidicola sp. P050]MDT0554143.1 sugar phosphate nucleotidyltransferase [Urechidicola sp. P050]
MSFNLKNPKQIIQVMLTGGVGSRLWPISRKSTPKQYLDIFDNKSLFQMTIERNTFISDSIYVVGNIDNRHLSEKILCNEHYTDITEATPRNTAAAIAFAAFEASANSILLVTPSDHIIKGKKAYNEALTQAIKLAEEGNIVTFGIRPTKPETGYGYIEFNGTDVISFREKPNIETAKEFIKSEKFLWNSGMFCFKANVFLDELKNLSPEIYHSSKKAFMESQNSSTDNKRILDFDLSMEIPSISVDYAVMERSEKIKVVPTEFEWSDLGSFEAVYDYLKSTGHPVDENGNMVLGSEKPMYFLGMKNTIFVSTPDANLILNKENSQEVKELYSKLEIENPQLLE